MNQIEEYWKFRESENHFNTIQAGIRNRASTWILAAFAAIAVLIKTSEETTWLVPSAVLIGLVSFMATTGLLILWINDQLVYQRLLGSVFFIGLKKEYDNPKLPPIRAMMMFSAEGKGMARWMALYYTIPMFCFLAISIIVAFLRESIGVTSKAVGSEWSFWILVAICIAQGSVTLWVQLKKAKASSKDCATLFGDPKFAEMFDDKIESLQKCGEIVERYNPD
jgi:hypothetical protein